MYTFRVPAEFLYSCDYRHWLTELKQRVEFARQRAAASVNRELVTLYWQIGHDILDRQQRQGWGAKVIDRLARDLKAAFPDMQGFSPRNLKYMRALAQAWPTPAIVQQAVAQLPWSHIVTLLDKLKEPSAHFPQRLLDPPNDAATLHRARLPW
ncbi:hypothetical protein Busp01_47400 [Trinickia caryophylli]|nr:hypothetical protein Busp01_47400 [Trinickia caryophylli]